VPYLDRDVLRDLAPRLPVVEFFYGWPDPALVAAVTSTAEIVAEIVAELTAGLTG
jgi:hypothetical protein